MLRTIVVDVLEMIIFYTDNYNIYEELRKDIIKLDDVNRESRIRDKLTKLVVGAPGDEYSNTYTINCKNNGSDCANREYDKPCYFDFEVPACTQVEIMWMKMGVDLRDNGLPVHISNGDQHTARSWQYYGYIFRNKMHNIPVTTIYDKYLSETLKDCDIKKSKEYPIEICDYYFSYRSKNECLWYDSDERSELGLPISINSEGERDFGERFDYKSITIFSYLE